LHPKKKKWWLPNGFNCKEGKLSIEQKTILWPPSGFNRREEDLSIARIKNKKLVVTVGGFFLWNSFFHNQSDFFHLNKKQFMMETPWWPLGDFFFFVLEMIFFIKKKIAIKTTWWPLSNFAKKLKLNTHDNHSSWFAYVVWLYPTCCIGIRLNIYFCLNKIN
jgi:hypothetical protein